MRKVMKQCPEGEKTLYLYRETKDNWDVNKARPIEWDKIRCGVKHFWSLGVDCAYTRQW